MKDGLRRDRNPGRGGADVEKLWNRNFVFLSSGSFVYTFGSTAAGFAFTYLVYDQSGSPLVLALFMVANLLPRMITGFLAGPFVDRHSRVKTISILNFASALGYIVLGLALFGGFYDVMVFTLVSALFGILDTVYQLAYMSLYPESIPKGRHSQAYAMASLLGPLSAAIAAPLAALIVDKWGNGIAWLLVLNGASCLASGITGISLRLQEELNKKPNTRLALIEDFREGFHYFRQEKGIWGITMLFTLFSFGYAVHGLLTLPFFMTSSVFTSQDYSFVISANNIGRMVGSLVLYKNSYPGNKRFFIAVGVYFIVELMSATYLFLPLLVLILLVSFVNGILSVTSYTIRMSSTMAYIPAKLRGRINSTQSFLWNMGTIVGAIATGFVAEYTGFDYRVIFLMSAVISLSAILLIPVRMHKDFKKIYNAEV